MSAPPLLVNRWGDSPVSAEGRRQEEPSSAVRCVPKAWVPEAWLPFGQQGGPGLGPSLVPSKEIQGRPLF